MSANTQNAPANRNLTRSPPESPRTSFMTSSSAGGPPALGRRYSLNLAPEIIQRLERRRASLDKLQVDKISPWMHLYDFTESVEN